MADAFRAVSGAAAREIGWRTRFARSRGAVFQPRGLTATSLVDSFADRDAFVASGMETGVVEGYRKLDALLAG
ncbi:MAG: hypothetical protein ABUL47_03185 [Leifsonia sp.]